jgi:transcriptional regulator with XRE-family HTH domain
VSVAFSGAKLASARLAAGLTQERLAAVLHTSQRRISDWERGMITPRPELMPKVAAAVGMDALEFVASDPATPSLEDMRLAAGLSMDAVADRIGISRTRYRAMEVGARRRDPAPEVTQALAKAFAVPDVTVRQAISAARSWSR